MSLKRDTIDKAMYLPIGGYFALNILCMFNAIKLLYCIVFCFNFHSMLVV